MKYRHIELKKIFARLNNAYKYKGTPLEIDAVKVTFAVFKSSTAYKRSIKGRIAASKAIDIDSLRIAVMQCAKEMTIYYKRFKD